MKCIISAGPTYESLDQVRRLTNFSTGALGTMLALYLKSKGYSVSLLRGEGCTHQITEEMQQQGIAEISQPFSSTEDLFSSFQLLSTSEPCAVFHTAAVSDFCFGDVYELHNQELIKIESTKYSTRSDFTMLAELKPTRKILAFLRELFPNAFIAGWKYETEGTQDNLLSKAHHQISTCKTDICVMNGPAYGQGFGIFSSKETNFIHIKNRELLYEKLLALLRNYQSF